MKRWVCPTCNVGALAPHAPALDDVRRFCLPCSASAPLLVRRIPVVAARAKAKVKADAVEASAAKKWARIEAKLAAPPKLPPLTFDDITLLVGVNAAWSIWHQFAVTRGRWKDTCLLVPATLIDVSGRGRSLTFRREDTGVDVAAVFRPSDRCAWVRERNFRLDGWRLNRNVFVSLAAEAPDRKMPVTGST